MPSWFCELFGEEEPCNEEPTTEAYEATRALFRLEEAGKIDPEAASEKCEKTNSVVDQVVLVSPNGHRFFPGNFEAPQLAELRRRVAALAVDLEQQPRCGISENCSRLQVEIVTGNIREMHTAEVAAGSVFQVASQFNCLEFIDPSCTPECGVTKYLWDKSQGPACALACAASTVWRNYFLPVNTSGQSGQRSDCQLNCLSDVMMLLGQGLIEVRNGYVSAPDDQTLFMKTSELTEEEQDAIRASLRIGIQWDAEVTDLRVEHRKNPETKKWEQHGLRCGPVTQVFCSAVALKPKAAGAWRPFAQLILEAAYEATLGIATLNQACGKSCNVYLTQLGGGNFHNEPEWIEAALRRALDLYQHVPLKVKLVFLSTRSIPEGLSQLPSEYS